MTTKELEIYEALISRVHFFACGGEDESDT